MVLPETEPKVFELFYEWLYSQKLWNKDVKEEDWPKTHDLVKLYIFGDMARVPSLQNRTLKALHQISNLKNEFPYGHMDFIWKNTSSTSPLRRYFLDQLIWYCEPEIFDEDAELFPSEARQEIIKAMNRKLRSFMARPAGVCISPPSDVRDYYIIPEEESAGSRSGFTGSRLVASPIIVIP